MLSYLFLAMAFATDCEIVININNTTVAELETLPGIGPSKAQEIYNYHLLHGDFKTIEELDNVKGIGPATLEAIRPCIIFNEPVLEQSP